MYKYNFFKSSLLLAIAVTSTLACDIASASSKNCTLSYRPKTNETAFAAVGSSLKIAAKTCVNSYLIIPFDTKAGAITIPQGQYAALKDEDGSVYFSVENDLGTRLKAVLYVTLSST